MTSAIASAIAVQVAVGVFGQSATPPLMHEYAEVNGVPWHYAWAGTGPLIVFLHGSPKFWYEWKNPLAEFSRDTRRWRQICAVTTCRRYVAWVQREAEKLSDPAECLVDHQSAARRAVDLCQRADTRIAEDEPVGTGESLGPRGRHEPWGG